MILRKRTIWPVVTGVILGILVPLSGCAAEAPLSNQAAVACPSQPLSSSVYLDGTGSAQSEKNTAAQVTAIGEVVARTAECEGHLIISMFGSSSGQTVTLYSGSLSVEAPTERGKSRKARELAEAVASEIASSYETARSSFTSAGTDIVGLLRLIEEQAKQAPGSQVEVLILTDGLTNIGVDPTQSSSSAEVLALADRIDLPDLSSTSLTFAGIGQTSTEIPSQVIERVAVFWERVCERTGAAPCVVVTDLRGQ